REAEASTAAHGRAAADPCPPWPVARASVAQLPSGQLEKECVEARRLDGDSVDRKVFTVDRPEQPRRAFPSGRKCDAPGLGRDHFDLRQIGQGGSRLVLGKAAPECDDLLLAEPGLELRESPLGEEPAVIDDADAIAEAFGLF